MHLYSMYGLENKGVYQSVRSEYNYAAVYRSVAVLLDIIHVSICSGLLSL